jgi:hypothetical protein
MVALETQEGRTMAWGQPMPATDVARSGRSRRDFSMGFLIFGDHFASSIKLSIPEN